ncbi:MAG: hypothetical protein JWN76_3631 [Chitinophagaceae bacterium]|nr:hypothetical protein [Chitinophagaceae bacterium]
MQKITSEQSLKEIRDIKQIMERSSRFLSLSGLSGVAAGCIALAGAAIAYYEIGKNSFDETDYSSRSSVSDLFSMKLFVLGMIVFFGALVMAFIFTYIRSRKQGVQIWGAASKRLLLNISLPLIAGGIFILKLLQTGYIGLIAPSCLIFYGLALINASKYTLSEVRYLGYGQLILGLISLYFIGYGLFFWAAGFGLLHIIYGTIMWNKYEKE